MHAPAFRDRHGGAADGGDMGKGFIPDHYLTSLYVVQPERLLALGIRFIFLDIDNTLVPSHAPDADDRVIHLINTLKVAGIQPVLVSNARRSRVERFNRPLGLKAVGNAWKPFEGGFRQAMEISGARPEETVMVGDQVFTDVAGGNRCGLRTILVQPMHRAEPFWIRWKRLFEGLFLGGMEPADRL